MMEKEELKTLQEQMQQVLNYSLLAAKNMLTIDDAALLTGLSKSYLYRLTCKREIPYSKPNGKMLYFDRAELEAWMRRNRQNSQLEAEQSAAAYCYTHSNRKGKRI